MWRHGIASAVRFVAKYLDTFPDCTCCIASGRDGWHQCNLFSLYQGLPGRRTTSLPRRHTQHRHNHHVVGNGSVPWNSSRLPLRPTRFPQKDQHSLRRSWGGSGSFITHSLLVPRQTPVTRNHMVVLSTPKSRNWSAACGHKYNPMWLAKTCLLLPHPSSVGLYRHVCGAFTEVKYKASTLNSTVCTEAHATCVTPMLGHTASLSALLRTCVWSQTLLGLFVSS